MALDMMDKKYIDNAINKALSRQFTHQIKPFFEQLSKENRNHMIALRESFRDDVKMLSELIQDRPTRSEVSTMIDVKIAPIEQRLIRIESHLGI